MFILSNNKRSTSQLNSTSKQLYWIFLNETNAFCVDRNSSFINSDSATNHDKHDVLFTQFLGTCILDSKERKKKLAANLKYESLYFCLNKQNIASFEMIKFLQQETSNKLIVSKKKF